LAKHRFESPANYEKNIENLASKETPAPSSQQPKKAQPSTTIPGSLYVPNVNMKLSQTQSKPKPNSHSNEWK
jgi:hypothetical protein